MRGFYILLVIVPIINSCSSKEKSDLKQLQNTNEISAYADDYLDKLTKLKKFNGVVLLKMNDEIVLRKAYNMTENANSTLYVNENSQFDLRSVSKLFAKVSILDLEKKGKLNRQDFIKKYLPDFPNGEKITIEHLMNNTSGLPRSFHFAKKPLIELKPKEVVEAASKEELEFEPGKEERYSNVGFQLMYYIIGKVNDATFSHFLDKRFFTPLQMERSGDNFYEGKIDLPKDYAYGHYLDNDKKLICEKNLPKDDMQMGNFHSTVDDLSNFLSILHNNDYDYLRQESMILHAGGTRGKRAYIERDFKNRYSIIFLANYDDIPFQMIVKDLQDILKGNEINMPEKVERKSKKVSEEVLKNYVGTYDFVDAGHLIITLRIENGNLHVYQNGNDNGIIYPETDTIFFADHTSAESIEFIKDSTDSFYALMDFKGVEFKGVKIK